MRRNDDQLAEYYLLSALLGSCHEYSNILRFQDRSAANKPDLFVFGS